MKTVSIDSKSLTLEDLLREAGDREVVFLCSEGETRYALVPADDGDREVCALKSNAEFLAYLTEAERRAHSQPRKTLEQIRKMFSAGD